MEDVKNNPLGTEKVSKLLLKFAVPSIISLLINACYNLVDQLFIGNIIGELGNAATNITFPFTNACLAFGLCFGVGGASHFNLNQGAGKNDKAVRYFGNAFSLLVIVGILLLVITEIFQEPILILFGAPETVLPYALDYTGIIALGFPFLVLTSGGGYLLRADRRPNIIMISNIIGCCINIGLDAWFIIGLGWGMKGAAIATIIGQYISGIIILMCLCRCKTFKLKFRYLIPKFRYCIDIFKNGLALFFNQVTSMIAMILLNNALKKYGSESIYGPEIPIAIGGIVSKVNSVFTAIIIGMSQAAQPVISFNYGAGIYRRVKEGYLRTLISAGVIAVISFLVFQLFPKTILSLFGNGSDLYMEYGCLFIRRNLMFLWLFFVQPISSHLFTAIGKSYKGMFLALTRQVIFFIPAVLLLPLVWGINGAIMAQPIADVVAVIATIIMVVIEMKTEQFRDVKGVLKEIITGKRR